MRSATYRLTFDDAVMVCLRRWDGDKQQDIAAAYRVNSARVNDVLKGRLHLGSENEARRRFDSAA